MIWWKTNMKNQKTAEAQGIKCGIRAKEGQRNIIKNKKKANLVASIWFVHRALHETNTSIRMAKKLHCWTRNTRSSVWNCAPIGSHHLPIGKRSFSRMKKVQSRWTGQLENWMEENTKIQLNNRQWGGESRKTRRKQLVENNSPKTTGRKY